MNNVISNWKEDYLDFIKKHKIPDDEGLCLRQANSDGEILFFVTYNKRIMQNEYYLYKIKYGKSEKVKTGDSPVFKELEV